MTTTYKCRLCLNEITKKIDIFKDDFPKMIELISGIKVHGNDGLLKYSCFTCARDVKFCMSIRKQILRSHKILCGGNVENDVKNENETNLNNVTKSTIECSDDDIKIVFEKVTIPQLVPQIVDNKTTAKSNDDPLLEQKVLLLEKKENISIEINANTIKSDQVIPLSTTNKQRNRRKNKFESTNNLLANRRFGNITFLRKIKPKPKNDTTTTTMVLSQRKNTNTSNNKPKVKRDNTIEKVTCDICKKEVNKHYINMHKNIHFPTELTCEICGVLTKNLRGLKHHKLYWHTTKLDYICDKCGKKYRSRNALTLHEKKEHGGIRDFECTICGKKFFQNMHLKRHIDGIHKKLRPHKCTYCGKDFSKRTHLVTHWRTHTNETPFSCDMCGERFKLKVTMKSHLKRVHNYAEEEKFFCTVCKRGFSSDVGLRAHLNSRIHEGRKCNHCLEVFTNEYMPNHLLEVHGINEMSTQE